ncbi:MAG: ABC transporter ATP-binding protein [Actinomycetota bacterium]|jgi:oligopeptide/dipeptide ABC transporter ATP-binding protein|nr:ABC transporter ATP-binding protein [Actinomycetota bacterium]
MRAAVLEARDLTKEYPAGRGRTVRAVRGVSVSVGLGETLGVAGESGCGKSTLARLLVGLEEPTSGSVSLLGQPLGGTERLSLARRAQLVFQDPFSSLNPRLTVAAALGEVLAVHGLAGGAGTGASRVGGARRTRSRWRETLAGGRSERLARVDRLLELVALGPRFADRYPHELSGGQAQRVAIARALAVEPKLLVLDEPTSALDVSVRAEIINLLMRLQEELSLSYVFISHDLSMVRHISDRVCVMYLGKVVEQGSWDNVLNAPLHPYTKALADAVPVPDPELAPQRATFARSAPNMPASSEGPEPPANTRTFLEAALAAGRRQPQSGAAVPAGEVAPATVAVEPAGGCPYHPRCPLADEVCRSVPPELTELVPGHLVACHVAVRAAGGARSGEAGLPAIERTPSGRAGHQHRT